MHQEAPTPAATPRTEELSVYGFITRGGLRTYSSLGPRNSNHRRVGTSGHDLDAILFRVSPLDGVLYLWCDPNDAQQGEVRAAIKLHVMSRYKLSVTKAEFLGGESAIDP